MSKIDRAHKNYLTPEIWEKTHIREIFYGTSIFQQSSMICIGRHGASGKAGNRNPEQEREWEQEPEPEPETATEQEQ